MRRTVAAAGGLTLLLGTVPLHAQVFDSEAVELRSWIQLPEFPNGGSGADIWGYVSPAGREYALMGLSTETAFVDITNPGSPVIVSSERHLSSPQPWTDIKVHGETAYVVTDASGGGVQIIDLSNIDAGVTQTIGAWTGGLGSRFTTAHNIAINNASARAYVIATNATAGFVIMDVSDPLRPSQLGVWADRGVHDMHVVTHTDGPYAGREIAYCACEGSGLAILDVTDPTSIQPLHLDATYPGLVYCHQCWLSDDRRYLFVNDELDEGNTVFQSTTTVFDVSNPLDPILHGQFSSGLPSTDHNLMVRGPYVFEANYQSGLRIFDVSNIDEGVEQVVEIAHFDTYPESDAPGFRGAWGVFADFPSGIVIVSDILRGLFVLDPVTARAPTFRVVNDSTLADTTASTGAAWGDVDGDGDPDLYVASEDGPDRLHRNDDSRFVDVSAPPLGEGGAGQGVSIVDFDDDGDLDLYLVRNNLPNRLFRNDGAGAFVDVAVGPIADVNNGHSAAWADYDLDGDLDLFLANSNAQSVLLRNDGGVDFADVTLPARIAGLADPQTIRGTGASWADFDGDRDPDLALTRLLEPNLLYVNEGDGTFTLRTIDGNQPSASSLGLAWGDADNDGDPDLYVANRDQPDTYLRNDDGTFADATGELDLADVGGQTFAAAWADYDLDGWLDLFRGGFGMGINLARNAGPGAYVRLGRASFPRAGDVYALTVTDYDGNGRPDIFSTNHAGANRLYQNVGTTDHFLTVRLQGTHSNSQGIGARVVVLAGGRTFMREIRAGTGYLSSGDPVARFGIGKATVVDELHVFWPGPFKSEVFSLAADRHLFLSEDGATPIDPHEPGPDPGLSPVVTRLHAAAPNPFHPTTTIRYDLVADSRRVRLAIYDVGGRRLRTLIAGTPAGRGTHRVSWDGRDERGRELGTGTYFYRLETEEYEKTRRVTLLR